MRTIIIIASILLPISANAQSVCGDAQSGLDYAKSHFGETVKWTGKDGNGMRLVLTTSPTGTWTLFGVKVVDDKEIACVLDSDGQQGQPS